MEIAISARSCPAVRCAYCHDRIDPSDRCSGCGTLSHADCIAQLGGCPTLGCQRSLSFRAPMRRRAAERAFEAAFESAVAGFAAACAWAVVALGCCGLILGILCDATAGLVGGAGVVGVGAAGLWALTRWRGWSPLRLAWGPLLVGSAAFLLSLGCGSRTMEDLLVGQATFATSALLLGCSLGFGLVGTGRRPGRSRLR